MGDKQGQNLLVHSRSDLGIESYRPSVDTTKLRPASGLRRLTQIVKTKQYKDTNNMERADRVGVIIKKTATWLSWSKLTIIQEIDYDHKQRTA